jgi:hypothetical protein
MAAVLVTIHMMSIRDMRVPEQNLPEDRRLGLPMMKHRNIRDMEPLNQHNQIIPMVMADIHNEDMIQGPMGDIFGLCNILLFIPLTLSFFSSGRMLSSTSSLFTLASNPWGANLYYFLGSSSNRLKTVHSKLSQLSIDIKISMRSPVVRDYQCSAKLFPDNDTDKKDKDDDDSSSHYTLFVHPR